MDHEWAAVLAGFLGGLLSAAIAIWVASRNIHQKAVLEQRQVWRDSIRSLVPSLLCERGIRSRLRIRNAIVLRLNPSKDLAAVQLIDAYVIDQSSRNRDAVVHHFQEMLKHDWERSKIEARFWSFKADERATKIVERQKVTARDAAIPGQKQATVLTAHR